MSSRLWAAPGPAMQDCHPGAASSASYWQLSKEQAESHPKRMSLLGGPVSGFQEDYSAHPSIKTLQLKTFTHFSRLRSNVTSSGKTVLPSGRTNLPSMVTCFYSMGCRKNQESWVNFIVKQNFSYILKKDRFNMFSFNFQIPVQVKYF